jgi:hypothetical protein
MNILVPQNPSCRETDLPVEGVCTAGDYSITQMATNEMLHKVPGVQFSFFDDNIVLSESIERAVNVIADLACSKHITKTEDDSCLQATKTEAR